MDHGKSENVKDLDRQLCFRCHMRGQGTGRQQSIIENVNLRGTMSKSTEDHNFVEEVNLLEYLLLIVRHKWLLMTLAFLGLVSGIGATKLIGPSWTADAIIAPISTGNTPSATLSGLSGLLGTAMGESFSMGGNVNVPVIEQYLASRDFFTLMIEEGQLLPYLFPKQWNADSCNWEKGFRPPSSQKGVKVLKSLFRYSRPKASNSLTLTVETGDSSSADRILRTVLELLDENIRKDISIAAQKNQKNLKKRLITTTDPLLQVKLQQLIASEVEKEVMVSEEAFEIIDKVYARRDDANQKILPLLGAVLFILTGLVLLITRHAMSSMYKNSPDKRVFEELLKQLLARPFTARKQGS